MAVQGLPGVKFEGDIITENKQRTESEGKRERDTHAMMSELWMAVI